MANVDLKSPMFQKIVLTVLLAGGVMGLFFCTHLLPFGYPNRSEKLAALKSEYEQKSAELARARATVADLPRFEAEYEQLHERWSLAAELLPTDRQMATLLRKVSLAAQQTGVTFMTFRPSPNRSEQYYTQIPMQISVSGGYHQVGSFLAELANLPRIVTVSGIKLQTNTKGDPLLTTSADFTASAYSLNIGAPTAEKPAAPAPAPAKKEGAGHVHKAS